MPLYIFYFFDTVQQYSVVECGQINVFEAHKTRNYNANQLIVTRFVLYRARGIPLACAPQRHRASNEVGSYEYELGANSANSGVPTVYILSQQTFSDISNANLSIIFCKCKVNEKQHVDKLLT